MASLSTQLRITLIDRVSSRMITDPVRMAAMTAVAAPLTRLSSVEEIAAIADEAIPAATPFERGVMIGAALAISAISAE